MKQRHGIQIVFMCCFCAEPIEDEEGELRQIGVAASDKSGDFLQQWWAHRNCFLAALNPRAWDSETLAEALQ